VDIIKYFGEDYIMIDPNKNNENYKVIDAFLDEYVEGQERKYCEPLKAVFMHETKNEMFLVLDCLNADFESIKNICDEWECRILKFVNFGDEYRENLEWLQYNINLLILCKDETGIIDDKYRFKAEKSTQVCRKIFLVCNNEGEIDDDEKSIIPFYFESVKMVDSEKIAELEKQLADLLPKDKEILAICEREELTDSDMQRLCRWLDEHAHN